MTKAALDKTVSDSDEGFSRLGQLGEPNPGGLQSSREQTNRCHRQVHATGHLRTDA